MKKFSKILLLGLFSFMACQSSDAHLNPAITKSYSNEEIDRMIDSFFASHSKDVIPSETLRLKFNSDFPKAKDIDWEVSSDIYEVEFEIGFTDYQAYYDSKGNLLMFSIDIPNRDVPAIVSNAALAKYPRYKIEDADKIRKGSNTLYKMEVEQKDSEIKVIYKDDGTFIKEWLD